VAWIGFSRVHVPYVPPARLAGRSKYTLTRMLQLASDAFFAFSSAPLMLVGGLGLMAFLVGAILLGCSLAGASIGWLPGLLCLLSGAQLAAIGLVGAYVGRIFTQSQARPLYILREAPEEASHEPRVVEVGARPSRRARSQ
jgi:dolichol-phosphate mannosyltransferase